MFSNQDKANIYKYLIENGIKVKKYDFTFENDKFKPHHLSRIYLS